MDHILITGGAGFIGTNLADHHLRAGTRVTVLDNFQRPGTRDNAAWLMARHGARLTIVEADVREWGGPLRRAVDGVEAVFHLAAQVAVTTSVRDPREDFEINALGTFNVLEAARRASGRPVVLFASTNKVYGKLDDLATMEREGRHVFRDLPLGVAETHSLDFHSPYGCSKGAGDQYVLDYHRIYGLPTVVMRQSCIYGPHQFGIADQGWVAWFAIQAMRQRPIVIYGDGRQVRDVLYVDDLVAAYDAAVANIAVTAGQAYNIGGGADNTLSLRELLAFLGERFGGLPAHGFDGWRPGDQLVFVSDIRKARQDFGWAPTVPVREGIDRMIAWLMANEQVFTLEQRVASMSAAPADPAALANA